MDNDHEQLRARLDRLEKAGDQIRFVMAIEKWAAGAMLMLLVFVVNQCSENATNIKSNAIRLIAINDKLDALDKKIELNKAQNQTRIELNDARHLTITSALQGVTNKLDGIIEKHAALDKQIEATRIEQQKNEETIRTNTAKLEATALSLQDLDKRATVNRETEAKDTVIIKELSLQSDNNLQRQIDTLGFQIQMILSPDKAIKDSLKPKVKTQP